MNRKSIKDSTFTCYAMKHNKTGKIYVGISSNVRSRIYTHLIQLRKQTHKNKGMLKDYKEFGNDYSFFILQEDIPSDEKYEVESKWMNELKTYKEDVGYNGNDKRFNKFVDMKGIKFVKGIPETN